MKQQIIKKFQSLANVQFIGINNYENSKGEVSNNVVNVGVSLENANKKDLETLLNLNKSDLETIAKENNFALENVEKAKNELIESFTNKVNGIQTTRSKAQTDAYINLGKGIRLKENGESFDLYIYGFRQQKTVITKGNYPKVNSSEKTLAKRKIEKTFLKSAKFANYKLSGAELLRIAGETFENKNMVTLSK